MARDVHTPHSELDYDVASAAQGLKGCDAVFPYDADRAYWGLHRWAELLIAERQGLVEQLEAAAHLMRSHVANLDESLMREQYPDSLGALTFDWLAHYNDALNPAKRPGE
jgi:hypothetical protein